MKQIQVSVLKEKRKVLWRFPYKRSSQKGRNMEGLPGTSCVQVTMARRPLQHFNWVNTKEDKHQIFQWWVVLLPMSTFQWKFFSSSLFLCGSAKSVFSTGKNFSSFAGHKSFQIFVLVRHLTNWTRQNLLTDKTLKKIIEDLLVRCLDIFKICLDNVIFKKITTFFNFKTCFDVANIIVSCKIFERTGFYIICHLSSLCNKQWCLQVLYQFQELLYLLCSQKGRTMFN